MGEQVSFHFEVDGDNFASAGEASVSVKKILRQLGLSPEIIRRVSIAMYEGEINMVIHADSGPGIADIELAMQAGYSTAPDTVRSLGFGAGMGLPNMKRYTDEMHIDSTVGVGTTVTMVVKI